MKGIVFTEFLEMVEKNLGFEIVDQLLEQTNLSSGGAYTVTGIYDHVELLNMVGTLQRLTGTPANDLLVAYGQHLFPTLISIALDIIKQFKDSFELLSSVDNIIHVEVEKLYPEAELPKFKVVKRDDKEMQLSYVSCRPFSHLAKGLILGCAQHYGEQVTVDIENREHDSLITITR